MKNSEGENKQKLGVGQRCGRAGIACRGGASCVEQGDVVAQQLGLVFGQQHLCVCKPFQTRKRANALVEQHLGDAAAKEDIRWECTTLIV